MTEELSYKGIMPVEMSRKKCPRTIVTVSRIPLRRLEVLYYEHSPNVSKR